MSAATPERLIDAIDGALEDWSVSTDAMRWSPEPAPRPRTDLMVRPTGLRFTDAGLIPSPLDAEAFASAFRYMASSYADTLNRMVIPMWEFGHAVRAASDACADIPIDDTAWRAPDPEPEPPDRSDVRAHALWRAQHRNTGPQRPTAGQAKRPRRP